MSCSCGNSNTSCTPCSPATITNESVASQITNLIFNLFGTVTKTIVDGRAVWTTPCGTDADNVLCTARLTDEGLLCYLLRIINDYGFLFGGTYAAGSTYCKNTVVVYGGIGYISLQNVPAGQQPDISPLYWTAALTGLQGPQGNVGPAGPAASPSYSVLSKVADYTVADNDVVILVSPAAATVITLPAIAATLAGKYVFIKNVTGAFSVTIDGDGAETVGGAATNVLALAGESVLLVSNNLTNWEII